MSGPAAGPDLAHAGTGAPAAAVGEAGAARPPPRPAAADEVWTVARTLAAATAFLGRRGSPSARLDAELLLAHCLSATRVRLYTHFDQPLSAPERTCFRDLLRRRGAGEPVAYLLGRREFYGRDFAVSPAVLVPRPETEHVVEAALAHLRRPDAPASSRLLDVGCGCGTLALTLAAEVEGLSVWATELSAAALQVAAVNAAALGVAERVRLLEGDLLAPLPAAARFEVVVSNPPYVDPAERAALPRDVVDFEPHLALFAAAGGMAVIGRLLAAAPRVLVAGGLLVCEIGATQGPAALAACATPSWREATVLPDLAGRPRVLRAIRA